MQADSFQEALRAGSRLWDTTDDPLPYQWNF